MSPKFLLQILPSAALTVACALGLLLFALQAPTVDELPIQLEARSAGAVEPFAPPIADIGRLRLQNWPKPEVITTTQPVVSESPPPAIEVLQIFFHTDASKSLAIVRLNNSPNRTTIRVGDEIASWKCTAIRNREIQVDRSGQQRIFGIP